MELIIFQVFQKSPKIRPTFDIHYCFGEPYTFYRYKYKIFKILSSGLIFKVSQKNIQCNVNYISVSLGKSKSKEIIRLGILKNIHKKIS